MTEKLLPAIDKPYDSPSGFTMWHPQFKHLRVQRLRDEVVITVSQPGADDVVFVLDLDQRDQLVNLLQQSPASSAQAATETVVTTGV